MEHFLDMHREHLGHAQAAEGWITGETDPATVGIGGERLAKAGRGCHHAVAPLRAFLVTAAVERGEHLAGQLAGLLQHRAGGSLVQRTLQFRETRPEGARIEDIAEEEVDVA
ncbi:hypothetical protein D9M68_406810 [compost metagenome]